MTSPSGAPPADSSEASAPVFFFDFHSVTSTRPILLCLALLIGALCSFPDIAAAQFTERPAALPSFVNDLSFEFDATANQGMNGLFESPVESATVGHKSGFTAALLSLAIPGLGEYYVGGDGWWRGLIFTGLEVGFWYGNAHWIGRGDDSTSAFQAFAHEHWSPSKYGRWVDSLAATFGGDSIITDPANFRQINQAEDFLSAKFVQNTSHRLPPLGAQQYYELISKYNQYTPGWDDAGNATELGVVPSARRHADMRANMNYQYEVADYYLYGVILNHILSAVDAALLARDHNSAVRMTGELREGRYPDGTKGYVPTARMTLTF